MTLPREIFDRSTANPLPADMAELFNEVYIVDGWNPTLVWNGHDQQALVAGIDAADQAWEPSANSAVGSPTSGVSPGLHFVRFRGINSRTGYPGNPSKAKQWVAAEGDSGTAASYTFSGITPLSDPKVDAINVELTRAGGGPFFRATTIANESAAVTIGIQDDVLAGRQLFYRDFGHGLPPRTKFIEAFRERLWFLGDIVYTEGNAFRDSGAATTNIRGTGTEWNSAALQRFLVFDDDSVKRTILSVVSAKELIVQETLAAGSFSTAAGYSITSDAPDQLSVSQPLFPQGIPAENRARVLAGRAEKATGMRGYRQDLVIFGERSMEVFVFTNDPLGDGRRERVEGDRGLTSRRCLVDAAGALWGLDYKGVHRWTGGISEVPQHVSEGIDPLFQLNDRTLGYVDFAYRETFHSTHVPDTHQIMWFVVLNGRPGDSTVYTQPNHALVFDYIREEWAIFRFDIAILASTLVPTTDGRYLPVIVDANGRAWAYGIGKKDGAPATQSRFVTLASGTSGDQVVLASGESFYASASGLAGAPLYHEANDEIVFVQSNSAAGGTLQAEPATSFTVGDRLAVGAIRGKWRTGALAFQKRRERVQGRYAHLYYTPLESGTARVRFYKDQSGSAFASFKADYSNEAVHHSGSGAIDYRIDLDHYDGYARIPIPGGQATSLEVEVIFNEGGVRPFFTGLELDGYSREEDQEP